MQNATPAPLQTPLLDMQKPPVKGGTPLALRKSARGDRTTGGVMEKDMTLATTYSSNGLPRKYHRRVGLNFRVRCGNGCFPDAMTTRDMSQMKTRRNCRCLHPQNCTSQLRPRPISTGQLNTLLCFCLLYTSDAADDLLCVDLGGRR